MSNPNTPAGGTPAAAAAPKKPAEEGVESIILVAYPKVVFLYPTMIAAVIAGLFMWFIGLDNPAHNVRFVVSTLFLGLLTVNLVVLAFDFPRATSLTLFFFIMALLMGALLLFRLEPNWFPLITRVLHRFHPVANATFYWSLALILGVIFVCVLISAHFDYWEVRPNELLHHHGILSNMERWAAPNLKIDKEINDVFEYFLLRSGTLILHSSDQQHSIILDNVPNIRKKEDAIMRMLGALQVEVRANP
jgi:hypothetical protein